MLLSEGVKAGADAAEGFIAADEVDDVRDSESAGIARKEQT